MIDFLDEGKTRTRNLLFDVFDRSTRKSCGEKTWKAVQRCFVLKDNAPAHHLAIFRKFRVRITPTLLYCLDLALLDYHVFLQVKK